MLHNNHLLDERQRPFKKPSYFHTNIYLPFTLSIVALAIQIQVATQITSIQEEWDEHLPAQHHLKARHLAALEAAKLPDIRYFYVRVLQEENVIGVIYLQLFSFQHKHINLLSLQAGWATLVRRLLPERLPLLICGHLFRIDFEGFYFSNPTHRPLLLKAIEIFKKAQQQRPCGTMIKDCNIQFAGNTCANFGYRFFDGDVTMELKRRPTWSEFDDYLSDLKKDYAKRAKKILRAMDGLTIQELTAAEIATQATAIEQLYWNVVHKQTIKLGTVNASYFVQLKRDLGERFQLHAIYEGAKMIGFYTFIFYDRQMETHYIGLDYEANKQYKLYFNILFAGIREMINRKLDSLELGRTARDAKANLGATSKQIVNYIQMGNPFTRLALKHVLQRFNHMEQPATTQRNPLR